MKMRTRRKVEHRIEISSWVIMSFLLILLVPRQKIREAQLSFLFKQVMTWLFGFLVVEKNLITYPKRAFFKKATKSSFTFEYFIYPATCALFNLYYPEKRSIWIKALYYSFHSGIITILEVIAVRYTKLIRYKNWKWYWSFLSIAFTNYLSHLYHKWFFKS